MGLCVRLIKWDLTYLAYCFGLLFQLLLNKALPRTNNICLHSLIIPYEVIFQNDLMKTLQKPHVLFSFLSLEQNAWHVQHGRRKDSDSLRGFSSLRIGAIVFVVRQNIMAGSKVEQGLSPHGDRESEREVQGPKPERASWKVTRSHQASLLKHPATHH